MSNRYGSAVVTLPSDTEILITRQFDAPRPLVWEALTRPEYVMRWWGPKWCPLVSAEIDLRVGGAWRYVARMDDGTELGWHGVYREINGPDAITSSEIFEGFPDAESVNTMTLTEVDGVTTLSTLVKHQSQEYRDGHVNSGMEGGMQDTFNRLDDLLFVFPTEAERFRRVAARFADVIAAVPTDAWANPAPPEGWTTVDVVRHLVEWVPGFFARLEIELPHATDVDADPAGAWDALRNALQAILDDPVESAREIDVEPIGRHTVAAAIDRFVMGDVLVHTWDLARAAGLDDTIDEGIAADMLAGIAPYAEMLVSSGQYAAAVPVSDDASVQDRLVAAMGRDPEWSN